MARISAYDDILGGGKYGKGNTLPNDNPLTPPVERKETPREEKPGQIYPATAGTQTAKPLDYGKNVQKNILEQGNMDVTPAAYAEEQQGRMQQIEGTTTATPQEATTQRQGTNSFTEQPPQKVKSFHEFVSAMEAARQLSPEQEAEMTKRRKRQSIASAIGDGLSALANLYFTTQYAPNVQGQGKLSEKNQARWDKWDAELKASRNGYADTLRKMEQAQAELQRKKDNDAADAERKKNADTRAEQLNRARIAKLEAATTKDAEQAALLRAKGEALEAGKEGEAKLIQAKIDELKSRAEKNKKQGDAAERNASANETRAAKYSGGSGGSGGKGGKGTYYGTFDGKSWKTAADYNKAVLEGAAKTGVPTTTGRRNHVKQRPIADVAREVEAKLKQQRQSGNQQSGGSKLKKTSSLGL